MKTKPTEKTERVNLIVQFRTRADMIEFAESHGGTAYETDALDEIAVESCFIMRAPGQRPEMFAAVSEEEIETRQMASAAVHRIERDSDAAE